MDLAQALTISARGMTAQTERLRVIAENIANQDSAGARQCSSRMCSTATLARRQCV